MEMKFSKLLDDTGLRIHAPEAVKCSVSFNAKQGEAQAFAEDGTTILATMVNARVDWIEAGGIRLQGMEPFDGPRGTQYRAMEWQLIFPCS